MATILGIDERKDIARKNFHSNNFIKEFFGERWFKAELDKVKFDTFNGFQGHELLFLLSNPIPSISELNKLQGEVKADLKEVISSPMNQGLTIKNYANFSYFKWLVEPVLKFKELNSNLEALKDKLKIKSLIKKAKNQFWDTLSEIEILASFEKNGILKNIEPTIDGKTPDGLINLEGRDMCIEIFTPHLAQRLENASKKGEATFLPNRLQGNSGLFAQKLSQLPSSVPSLLIINKSFSEIDDIEVEDALYGSSAVRLTFDKITGQCVSLKGIREDNGLPTLFNNDIVSGVIIYKREVDLGPKLITTNFFKEHSSAKYKLTQTEIKRIEAIFNSMLFSI